MFEIFVYALVILLSIALVGQAVFTLALMLYTWGRPERLEKSGSPDEYLPPQLSFTAILPARHEEGVIGATLKQIWQTSYPKDLLEMVVVCEESDRGTIEEAEAAAREIGHPGVRVLSFAAGDKPVNKPRGLNVALAETSNEVVTIFDAEDDVHPEIFDVINTTMQQKDAPIVQAGVQLMDFESSWYSLQNVLEYFFYFKSRLHFHAEVGMIPLGGNTVFIKRPLLEKTDGWDEACLTEDADVGIRLSALGERIAVTYDSEHATREETPSSLGSFIKQRTRWCQGFFQVFRKGDWKRLPTRAQRMLAAYTLTYPYVQAFVGALWIPAVIMMIYLNVPVGIAILSLLPLYAIGFQFLINLIGLFDFASSYDKHVRLRDVARFTLGFLPYQVLLSVSALRAVFREALGATNWEKTAHSGSHRAPDPQPATPHVAAPQATATTGAQEYESPFPAGEFEQVLREAGERFGAERGSVMVLEPGEESFSIRASRGLPEEALLSARPGMDEEVAGWAVSENAAAIIHGGKAPPDLSARFSQPELHSSVVLPVEKDGVWAVVNISSKSVELHQDALDWLDVQVSDLMEGLDEPAGGAWRNTWREVERHV